MPPPPFFFLILEAHHYRRGQRKLLNRPGLICDVRRAEMRQMAPGDNTEIDGVMFTERFDELHSRGQARGKGETDDTLSPNWRRQYTENWGQGAFASICRERWNKERSPASRYHACIPTKCCGTRESLRGQFPRGSDKNGNTKPETTTHSSMPSTTRVSFRLFRACTVRSSFSLHCCSFIMLVHQVLFQLPCEPPPPPTTTTTPFFIWLTSTPHTPVTRIRTKCSCDSLSIWGQRSLGKRWGLTFSLFTCPRTYHRHHFTKDNPTVKFCHPHFPICLDQVTCPGPRTPAGDWSGSVFTCRWQVRIVQVCTCVPRHLQVTGSGMPVSLWPLHLCLFLLSLAKPAQSLTLAAPAPFRAVKFVFFSRRGPGSLKMWYACMLELSLSCVNACMLSLNDIITLPNATGLFLHLLLPINPCTLTCTPTRMHARNLVQGWHLYARM